MDTDTIEQLAMELFGVRNHPSEDTKRLSRQGPSPFVQDIPTPAELGTLEFSDKTGQFVERDSRGMNPLFRRMPTRSNYEKHFTKRPDNSSVFDR